MQAGLFNNEEGITHFTPYGTPIQRSPDAAFTDQLSLALEPECVALYCQQLPINDIAEYADQGVNDAKSCIVLDIGGGTVDITALKQVTCRPDSYEVTVSPTGNEFGGKEVNEEFRRFLQQIVSDEGFQLFLKNQSTREEHNAILQKMIYHDFEEEKVHFGTNVDFKNLPEGRGRAETQPVPETQANKQVPIPRERSSTLSEYINNRLELPEAFLKCYKKIDRGLKDKDGVKLLKSNRLLLLSDSMMKSFFNPVLTKMSRSVICAVREANESGHLSVVYMAGGFGGCKYVYQYLKDKIELDLPNTNVPLVVPSDHKLAVCKGAVLYGRNPGIITIRKMEASYGIRVSKPFQEGVHEERHAYGDQDGTKRCGNIFRPFVVQGDRVKANEVFTIKLVPQFHTDTEARIGFYCSTNPNVRYTNDEGTSQIGEIRLSIPNPTHQPVTERIIEITMNFSSTEIKATARASYLNDKPPVSTVLDFLN